MNLFQKILAKHLVTGDLIQGVELAIHIDQTLTQDASGTLAFLQFEAMGAPKIKTRHSVSYVDHNTLQTGYENADDQRYLQSVSAKYGAYFSRAGNGVSNQVHLERFAVPGQTLLGSDPHVSMNGAAGMLAISAGGLDIALAMSGQPFYLTMPRVLNVVLRGKLKKFVTPMDVALELLRRLTVRGGLGKALEFSGPGVAELTVPERATIANVCAELGAVSVLFPSDRNTRAYLAAQKRGRDFTPLAADKRCLYDEQIELNLAALEPLIALPHQPDHVESVRKIKNVEIDQVIIGSSSNGSYDTFKKIALLLKGRHVNSNTSLILSPASRQVMQTLAREGLLTNFYLAGARVLEPACGPSQGIGMSPGSNQVSLRTFSRNTEGISGTRSAKVYLCSPETALASALQGRIADPATLKKSISLRSSNSLLVDDAMLVIPPSGARAHEIFRGPNIKPIPVNEPMTEDLNGQVLLKLGNNFTTDQILPAGPQFQLRRSNVPALAHYLFYTLDRHFMQKARQFSGGFIVAGENYGQGDAGEHAAMALMFLSVRAIFAKSFSRLHRTNLIHFGIIPLTFVDPDNYANIDSSDRIEIPFVKHMLTKGKPLVVKNLTKHRDYNMEHGLTPRQCEIVLAGGLLNYIRQSQ